MTKTIVKIGFTHQKVYHGAGHEVSEELAKLYPEFVKTVGSVEKVEEPVKEEKVKEAKVEEPVKATKKKFKK